MRDPRKTIKTPGLCCSELGLKDVWAIYADQREIWAYRTWDELTAFASAILAADAEWREQNAPTFVALREKYVDRNFWLLPHNCANDCVMTDMDGEQRSHVSMGHALEWLAAKLAELEERR